MRNCGLLLDYEPSCGPSFEALVLRTMCCRAGHLPLPRPAVPRPRERQQQRDRGQRRQLGLPQQHHQHRQRPRQQRGRGGGGTAAPRGVGLHARLPAPAVQRVLERVLGVLELAVQPAVPPLQQLQHPGQVRRGIPSWDKYRHYPNTSCEKLPCVRRKFTTALIKTQQ